MKGNVRTNIQNTYHRICDLFRNEGMANQVLVLDFSHYSHLRKNTYHISMVLYGFKEIVNNFYRPTFFNFHEEWLKFPNENLKIIYNYNSGNNWNKDDRLLMKPVQMDIPEKDVFEGFEPHTMIEDLQGHKGIGNCVLFLSRCYNAPESQSVLYVTFEHPLPGISFDTKFDYNSRGTLLDDYKLFYEKLFNELDELLINEMIHSLFISWKETELQKKLIGKQHDFKDIIHRNLFHNQREYIFPLDVVALKVKDQNFKLSEFIKYISESLNEFLDVNRYLSIIKDARKNLKLQNLKKAPTSLTKIILDIIDLITFLIIEDKRLVNVLKIQNHQYDGLVRAAKELTLFRGNFQAFTMTNLELPVGVPKLIIKEVLINVIRYSLYSDPWVEINITDCGSDYHLQIGSNLPASDKEMRLLQNPIDKEHRGMFIIKELSKKIGWKFSVTRRNDIGSPIYNFIINKN